MIDKDLNFEATKSAPNILPTKEQLRNPEIVELCHRYAKDLWNGIEEMADNPLGIPTDRLIVETDEEAIDSRQTSPTNMGLFLASIIAARDLALISTIESDNLTEKALTSLEHLTTYNGLFYNWYDTQTGGILEEERQSNSLSAVDNAWLAVGLMVVETAMPKYADRAKKLIDGMKFSLLYDLDRDLFFGELDGKTKKPLAWYYAVLNTEARIINYVGISRFNIPDRSYTHLGRIAPTDTVNENYQPSEREFLSWSGGMFEALMPTIFVPEQEWSPLWKENQMNFVKKQIAFGQKYSNGFWGFSPCDDENGEYIVNGLEELSIYKNHIKDQDVITPHASFLALQIIPEESLQNLQRLEATYSGKGKKTPIYRQGYGFSDAVNVKTDEVSHFYLSLDQQMSFLALSNFMNGNRQHHYFVKPIEKSIKPLISSLDA